MGMSNDLWVHMRMHRMTLHQFIVHILSSSCNSYAVYESTTDLETSAPKLLRIIPKFEHLKAQLLKTKNTTQSQHSYSIFLNRVALDAKHNLLARVFTKHRTKDPTKPCNSPSFYHVLSIYLTIYLSIYIYVYIYPIYIIYIYMYIYKSSINFLYILQAIWHLPQPWPAPGCSWSRPAFTRPRTAGAVQLLEHRTCWAEPKNCRSSPVESKDSPVKHGESLRYLEMELMESDGTGHTAYCWILLRTHTVNIWTLQGFPRMEVCQILLKGVPTVRLEEICFQTRAHLLQVYINLI